MKFLFLKKHPALIVAFFMIALTGLTSQQAASDDLLLPLHVTKISAGLTSGLSQQSHAIKEDGSLWTWGRDALASGDGLLTPYPHQIGQDDTWTDISGGNGFTLAAKSDGGMWAWGSNSSGILGANCTLSTSPLQIGADNDWAAVAAGASHALALKIDGSLWAWGRNTSGQVGDNSIANRTAPTQVFMLDPEINDYDWLAIAAGEAHSLALKYDGTLWGWGNNQYKQVSNLASSAQKTPMLIGNDFAAISAGRYHSLGLKTDGTLWGWGYNNSGQLGNGSTIDASEPTPVGEDNDWVAVDGGWDFTLARKSDNTLWGWGSNAFGKLGDPAITSSYSPVQIGSDTDWIAVDAGSIRSLALKSDGSIWGWGRIGVVQEISGQFTYTNAYEPIPVNSTPPVGEITIDSPIYTNKTAVPLLLTCIDDIECTKMRIANSTAALSKAPWKPYASSYTWSLGSVSGKKTIFAQFADSSRHILTASVDLVGDALTAYSDIVYLDTLPPKINAFLINKGSALYTKIPTVSLSQSVSGANQMRFLNYGGAWSDWQPFSTVKSWNVGTVQGVKKVTADFKDQALNWSRKLNTVILDRTAPLAASAMGITKLNAYTWRVSGIAKDPVCPGRVGYCSAKVRLFAKVLKNSNTIVSKTSPWTTNGSKAGLDFSISNRGTYTLEIYLQDMAGNLRLAKSATIVR